uniref:Malic enzyme NAD-binding domain-containing protein n=1 Tax=Timema douglasi TaxID=61478 RepID=A0A7R8VI55_TIMDO|nr:unnamed protein product [Timema douglasi]
MFFLCQALADMVTEEDLEQGRIYPPLKNSRQVSLVIATAISQYAYDKEPRANGSRTIDTHGRESETRVSGQATQPDAPGAMRPCAVNRARQEGEGGTGKPRCARSQT